MVSGFPWQEPSTSKEVGVDSLTTKCLCTAHNTALSPLDQTAGQLFTFIDTAYSKNADSRMCRLLSGHDIERWLLKTLIALSNSNNLMSNRKLLRAPLHPSVDVAKLLQSPLGWPVGSGLYLSLSLGQTVVPRNQFGIAPLTVNGTGELVGMQGTLLGIDFYFIAAPPNFFTRAPLPGAYRPGKLTFAYTDGSQNTLQLSWDDLQKHGDLVFTAADAAGGSHPV